MNNSFSPLSLLLVLFFAAGCSGGGSKGESGESKDSGFDSSTTSDTLSDSGSEVDTASDTRSDTEGDDTGDTESETDKAPPLFDAINYSPYRDGQQPGGATPTESQIREDIRILLNLTDEIRTYSTDSTGRTIVQICHEEGMKVHVGTWLGDESKPGMEENNRSQIEALVELAAMEYPEVQSLIVGNEALLLDYLTSNQLVKYIEEVKERTEGYPVTTAMIFETYYFNRDVADAVDIILFHIHPYWFARTVEEAASWIVQKWIDVEIEFPQKPVFIGETGWPTGGDVYQNRAVPSEENQKRFIEDFLAEAEAYNAMEEGEFRYMLFEAFDEAWKTDEGEVGGHWGLFYSDRTPKPAVQSLFEQNL